MPGIKQKIKNGYFLVLLLTVSLMLSIAVLSANGQVIIVPSKLRPARASGKIKTRPRAKTSEPVESVEEAARSTEMPPSEIPLAFVVTPPPLNQIGMVNDKSNDRNGEPSTIWPELLRYEFEVIKLDARGHLEERRKERARLFVENLAGGVAMEMVEIPSGTFLMGSNPFELEQVENSYSRGVPKETRPELQKRLSMETPQKIVKVPAFYLGKYEVTQAQWRAVASLPKVSRELMSDPSNFKGGNRPVEQVSWEDAVEFCERLSRATGRRYRLPTESEWEYACRSGTKWPFSFGETIEVDWVNYNGKLRYASASRDTNRQQTIASGSLNVANAFGLYDMHGNVWEWCQDVWHEGYTGSPADSSAWLTGDDTSVRVLRGGAWDSAAGECRSSERRPAPNSFRFNNVGFRVVVEPESYASGK